MNTLQIQMVIANVHVAALYSVYKVWLLSYIGSDTQDAWMHIHNTVLRKQLSQPFTNAEIIATVVTSDQ